jgi:hypothetical protein
MGQIEEFLMDTTVSAPIAPTFAVSPLAEVESNQQLVELWLHGKSADTCNAYRRDIHLF